MSIAMERMSAEERRSVAESLLTEVVPYKAEEIGSHCPFHAEQTPGGAFFYNFAMDSAYCHSCSQTSDLVGIFNVVHGRAEDDADGCREFVKTYCPENGPVRVPSTRRQERPRRQWHPGGVELPPKVWREKANLFVEHAVERLQDNPEQLAELERFGIDADTARACRFGWNDRDKWPPFSAWGLPKEMNDRGKERKVWLPEGLVIPAVREGEVVKLKIRRPNPVTPWGENRKYWEVKGGANGLYHVYGSAAYRAWVLVETERDAAMIWAACRGLGIGAMGTGGAAKRPCGFVADTLRRAAAVLNAFDYDKAGAKNTYKFWEREFPNCLRWPAPPSMGKDAGEAFEAGLDLRGWVLEGLPGHIRRRLEQGVSKQREPQRAPAVDSSAPKSDKPYFEQVLEWMEGWPQWRDRLVSMRQELRELGAKVYRDSSGSPWIGLVDQDYPALHGDADRLDRFNGLVEAFHARQVLDDELGLNSLANIVDHYFGSRLEVRG
ncbi:hypothetical protein [Desulfovibrio oxyclinae]|uniref:hypothetical protein n=1 Tax=Desulfovibrio oxyclinae TaxID=63560 RepID=UPI0006853536|nr:hypothetical protein [Desulfovibrio oxyclinae]